MLKDLQIPTNHKYLLGDYEEPPPTTSELGWPWSCPFTCRATVGTRRKRARVVRDPWCTFPTESIPELKKNTKSHYVRTGRAIITTRKHSNIKSKNERVARQKETGMASSCISHSSPLQQQYWPHLWRAEAYASLHEGLSWSAYPDVSLEEHRKPHPDEVSSSGGPYVRQLLPLLYRAIHQWPYVDHVGEAVGEDSEYCALMLLVIPPCCSE